MHIDDLAVVLQCLDPMRAPFWNEESRIVSGRQFLAKPLPEGRGTTPQINSDIEHRAANARDQLGLGMRRQLNVETPHRPGSSRPDVIDLDCGPNGRLAVELGEIEKALEGSSLIRDWCSVYNADAVNGSVAPTSAPMATGSLT